MFKGRLYILLFALPMSTFGMWLGGSESLVIDDGLRIKEYVFRDGDISLEIKTVHQKGETFAMLKGMKNGDKKASLLTLNVYDAVDRGQGLGSKLFRRTMHEIFKRGCDTVLWNAVPHDYEDEQIARDVAIERLINFYKQFGSCIKEHIQMHPLMELKKDNFLSTRDE